MADASYDKNWAPELLAAGITPDADPLDLKALLRQIIAKVGAAGNTTVRKFAFAFNSPGILTGHSVYTPTIGDILLDAWIEIDTAWDGTTPTADFGTFAGGDAPAGWMGTNGSQGAWSLLAADRSNMDDLLSQAGAPRKLMSLGVNYTVAGATNTRQVPAKFIGVNPIKVVVSQDGTNTGADPGSTQGAAILFLVTATPA